MVEWKVKDLLKGSEPEELIKELENKSKGFRSHRDSLNNITPEKLKDIILEIEEIEVLLARIYSYYSLQMAEKTDDTVILGKLTKLNQLSTEIKNDTMFLELWFIELEDGAAEKLANSQEVKEYKYYLETLRKAKPHTKTEEIERIINIKSITGSRAFAKLYDVHTNDFKYEFQGKTMTREELSAFIHSEKKEEREDAYKVLLKKYKDNSVLLSEIYKNIVLSWDNEGLKIRDYKTPISVRNLNNDIADEHVETMIKVIRKNASLFTEYFKLKHEMQAKKGDVYPFSRYHLYAPYKTDLKKDYDYERCKEITLQTYKEFDERFYEATKEIFDKEHVHSHPKDKKRGGAFMMAVYNEETPYIMLNHTDKLRDLFTMMHEFGHGIHYCFARKQVNLLYDCALPMAETASIFGEMILASKMLEESQDDEEKKSLLINLLDDQYASIIRQTYFTLFEQVAHDKIMEGATKEELEEEYYKLLEEQFGDMEVPESYKNEWNYIPHFHASPFYCYAYSWGCLVTLSFYKMYKEKGKEFIDKYVEMLSKGGGESPAELMAILGADPRKEEFWQKGFDIVKEEIEELKGLHRKT